MRTLEVEKSREARVLSTSTRVAVTSERGGPVVPCRRFVVQPVNCGVAGTAVAGEVVVAGSVVEVGAVAGVVVVVN